MTDSAPPPLLQADCLLVDEAATRLLAAGLARHLVPGFRLYLAGGLGAGKTTFTRAMLRSLGVEGRIKSPTFALLEPYNLPRFELHHYDFYRLEYADAWRDAGFESSFDSNVVVVVEWPDKAGDTLPKADLRILFQIDAAPASMGDQADLSQISEQRRRAFLVAFSERGRTCLTALLAEGCCNAGHSPAWGCAPHGSSAPS